MRITPDNTAFVLLSFEGPDRYSLAGGLGVRVTNLAQTLSQSGFPVHLFFVGDPKGKGEETSNYGKLTLHRWCQWISEYYPNGVYQGENEKLYDFNKSIPEFIADRIIKPALEQNRLVVILGEEWHTAEAMCRISDVLQSNQLKDQAIMFWNANNTFGFDRIDWARLARLTTITTVSRYMKHIMQGMGVDPLVIPNGIPSALLNKIDVQTSSRVKKTLGGAPVLAKIARWDPDKGWEAAIEATAGLKRRGRRAVLVARGGIEPYGEELMYRARSLGLKVREVNHQGNGNLEDYLLAIGGVVDADILNIKFHCPQQLLRLVYHASDAVLANSRQEPFGLVGLETMAAGGVAFTGGTGEDYAIPFLNAIVLETSDPKEIEEYVLYLEEHPEDEDKIRKAARNTARHFTWDKVIKNLIRKLEHQAGMQGLPISEKGENDDAAIDTDFTDVDINSLRIYAGRTQHGKEEDSRFKQLAEKPLSSEQRKMMKLLIEEHEKARGIVNSLS